SALFAICVLATIGAWATPVFLRDHGAYLTSVVTQPDLSWHPDRTSREFYWYAGVLATGFLPLVLLLPAVAIDVRRHGWTVAVVTSIAMLAILMIAPKKRLHYLLPVYPFLTLAVAEAVVRFRDVRWLERLAWSLIGLSLVAGPIYYGLIQPRSAPAEDPEIEFASALLPNIEPTARVVCVDDECDAIALI